MAAHTFNVDYYATCATVIPVFLIALIVPGGALSRLADQMRVEDPKHGLVREIKHAFAYLGLTAAFLGESTAMAALRFQRACLGKH